MTAYPPLLVVGHGTAHTGGVADFLALVARAGRRMADSAHRGEHPVEGCDERCDEHPLARGGFIELSAPPLTDAVESLWQLGHRRLAAVPLMLVSAGHAKGDIPGAMVRELERHPGLTYSYGRPLGPHPILLELLAQRIDTALAGSPRKGTTIVLVGRGSTDPDANAEVSKMARLLWEGRGYDGVETSFISLAPPGVPAALERARLLGSRRVVVAPYFLFRGVLPDRVVEQSSQWAREYPDIDVRVADVLGDCDDLADLVVERYREALGDDLRMNCDTCVYRSAMTGFEGKVGAPQTPHNHPDDPAHGNGHGHGHEHAHAGG